MFIHIHSPQLVMGCLQGIHEMLHASVRQFAQLIFPSVYYKRGIHGPPGVAGLHMSLSVSTGYGNGS